ncbi:MAG: hypothetical protein WKG32_12825 [Gemmatimonadaceae bacterium]
MNSAERFGLDTLLDLSCLVRAEFESADVVDLVVEDESAPAADVRAVHAAGWGIRVDDACVRIPRGSLSLVTEIAGLVAEQRSSVADRFGRVPSAENALVAAAVERVPVVSLAAVRLRESARDASGRRVFRTVAPWPNGRDWCVALTHDLDVVDWWPLFSALRVAELVTKRDLRRAWSVTRAAASSISRQPVWNAVNRILELEARGGVPATWFLLSGVPTLRTFRHGDLTYRLDAPLGKRIVSAVRSAGHELGLHGSFATLGKEGEFGVERERLQRESGSRVEGVRQHFLRMRPGQTQRAMRDAGFKYDATPGFPDRNGFRLGLADVVLAWDAARQSASDISLVPLVWMDRALSKYAGVEDPQEWVTDAIELMDACRRAGGLWTGLWHPNMDAALGYPHAMAAFERLLEGIGERQPHVGTLGDIVSWRESRRAFRAQGLSASGAVVRGGSVRSADTIQLLDQDLRLAQSA